MGPAEDEEHRRSRSRKKPACLFTLGNACGKWAVKGEKEGTKRFPQGAEVNAKSCGSLTKGKREREAPFEIQTHGGGTRGDRSAVGKMRSV